nr:hypothetical protein CFP56_53214 [Quercus suber]
MDRSRGRPAHARMATGSKRHRIHERKSWDYRDTSILIRVGSRHDPRKFHESSVSSGQDAPRISHMIEDQVRAWPRDPLIVSVNGYQPWLEDVLGSCIKDYWSDIADLDREVQFAGTMRLEPPDYEDFGLPEIEHYRFRVGVWECGRGACRFDRRVPVVIIFTRPTIVSEHVVTELLFTYLYRDADFNQPREDEEGICWTFSRLYYLLSDWQNIVGEIATRLDEAETNSHGRHLPVKWRTRLLHSEVDRLYELKEYLRFQSRAFRKLQKLKNDVPGEEQKDPLWNEMDDAIEDLEQNAVQADNAQFLSVIATITLPVSFLASVFGITTLTWPAIYYLYAAVPMFITSCAAIFIVPWLTQQTQRHLYPLEQIRIPLQPRAFTMLGDELPDNVDVPGGNRRDKVKRKALRPAGMDGGRSRSRSRFRRKDMHE